VVPPAFTDSIGLRLTLTGEPGSLTMALLRMAQPLQERLTQIQAGGVDFAV